MAHSKGIDNLSQDPLKEIMTRVGQKRGGAADVARAFSVSKTLRDFVDDGDVLRSISFKGLFPCFVSDYKLLSEIGGLVVRCARAGNLRAQFILSKVVLASSSELCSANIGALHPDASLNQHSTLSTQNCNLTDLYKATRLLDHLSVENTDPSELLDLIRNFLSRAKVEDVVEMQQHLKNFVALFLVHGNKLLFQQFIEALDQLRGKIFFPIVTASDPRNFINVKLNGACTMGYDMMGSIEVDEVVYRPLLECMVKTYDDDIVYETLLERVYIVENILKIGGQMASAQNNHEALLTNRGILCVTAVLKGYLRLLIDRTAYLQISVNKVLATFNALSEV